LTTICKSREISSEIYPQALTLMDNFIPSGRCELDAHDTSRTQLSSGSNHLRAEVRPQFAMTAVSREQTGNQMKNRRKTGQKQVRIRPKSDQNQVKLQ
jgi:hypothetical protein